LFNEPTGPEVNGYDALTRFYSTASGIYVLLSAYEQDLPRLDKVEGLEGIALEPEEGRAAFLSQAFQGFPAEEWVERLHAADIGVAICNNIDALRAENTRLADGTPGTHNGSYSFSYYPDHPSGHEVTQLDPYAVRTAVSKINALLPTEKFGNSTRIILEELGYGQEAIKKLLISGDISDSWSKEYLPS
jgi:crotonobetainyl-CoA:carnitine CoA-transferase CaiB-like acyl-CoA transferase